jgi:hypothetical protein
LKKYLLSSAFAALIVLASCSAPVPEGTLVQSLGERTGTLQYGINLGSDPKDLFFVFSNGSRNDRSGQITLSPEASAMDAARVATVPELDERAESVMRALGKSGRKSILKDAPNLPKRTSPLPRPGISAGARGAEGRANTGTDAPNTDVADETGTFQTYNFYTGAYDPLPATCRYISSASPSDLIQFPDGAQRKLSIWVEDAQWGTGSGEITQEMVNALAARFFGTAAENREDSIYYWVTNILGQEWGDLANNEYIPYDRCITILLADLNRGAPPNASSVVVGFFDPSQNFTDIPYSNERVMFYADSALYANPDNDGIGNDGSPWASTDYWAEEMYSTLAHEFQHMVAMYQLEILDAVSLNSETWFAELCSQAIEDLVADKMGVMGPRGVPLNAGSFDYGAGAGANQNGRIPLYNVLDDLGLLRGWDDERYVLAAYSQVYSFGAYLLRNYGGAEFMQGVFEASGSPEARIEEVCGIDFNDLLARWAVAVLLSDRTDAPDRFVFNTGNSFDSVVGGLTYRLGSMNFFNYWFHQEDDPVTPQVDEAYDLTGPWIYSRANISYLPTYYGYSSVLCLADQDVTGKKAYQLRLPGALGVSALVP